MTYSICLKSFVVYARQVFAAVLPTSMVGLIAYPESFDNAVAALCFTFFVVCILWEKSVSEAVDRKAECMKFFDEVVGSILTGLSAIAIYGVFVEDSKIVLVSTLLLAIKLILMPAIRLALIKWNMNPEASEKNDMEGVK